MALVSRKALVMLQTKNECVKPHIDQSDGVTQNPLFPTDLRYIVGVIESGRKLGKKDTEGSTPGRPEYCMDVISINIEESEIEDANNGKCAWKENESKVVLLDKRFHIKRTD